MFCCCVFDFMSLPCNASVVVLRTPFNYVELGLAWTLHTRDLLMGLFNVFFFFFLWTRCTWRVKVLNAYVIVHLWQETRLCPNASTRTAEGLVWHELVFLPWMLLRGWVTVEANSNAGTGVGDGTAAGASGQQLPCSKCNINRANRLYR